MNTPRIDKPSLLTNRKDEAAFPQRYMTIQPTQTDWKLPPARKWEWGAYTVEYRVPGPAGAMKPVEQKEASK